MITFQNDEEPKIWHETLLVMLQRGQPENYCVERADAIIVLLRERQAHEPDRRMYQVRDALRMFNLWVESPSSDMPRALLLGMAEAEEIVNSIIAP